MKTKLIINGAAGRMGRRIVALAAQGEQFDIIGATEVPAHPDIGKDAGVLAGIGSIGIKLDSNYPAKADIMIDLSIPQDAKSGSIGRRVWYTAEKAKRPCVRKVLSGCMR